MKKIILSLITILILCFAHVNYVSPDEITPLISPEPSGRLEGEGTHFELIGIEYLNITLDSSEPIKVVLESVPEMVALYVEPVSELTSAQITLGGFLPLTTYYKYEDDYHNLEIFTTDGSGKYTYSQDLAGPHFVYIQPRPSTYFLNDNGWSDPSIGSWDPTTRTATLIKDINQTIQIDVDNVTVDGNNHTIVGNNNIGIGIVLYEKTGVVIKDLKIQNFWRGVNIYSATDNELNNILLSNNTYGIYLGYSSTNNRLTDNTITNNRIYGILLDQSGNNTLRSNLISENTYNFEVNGSTSLHFENDIDTTNLVQGKPLYYLVGASDIEINAASNAGKVYCINCNNITVKDLDIAGNSSPKNNFLNAAAGIYFYNTSNSIIENNTIYNNTSGIRIVYSNGNDLMNNTLTNNYFGINLYLSDANKLTKNIATTNFYGIYSSISHTNILEYNTTNNNTYGAYLIWSHNNTVSNSNSSNNSFAGIGFGAGVGNIIKENTINSNGYYGLILGYISSPSLGNQVYHNNFINNVNQVYADFNNLFNLDLPIGGNYWSDWTSPDSNGDGIVDSPYVFSNGQDNFPWDTPDWWKVVESDSLIETSFTETTLIEDIVSKKATLSSGVISGDLEGAISINNFEIVSVASGSFSGKGFSKGEVQFTIGAASYSGDWQGVNYFKSEENKIYLKGIISGGISGIVEGFLSESIPESGIYDQFQATGEINQLGSETIYAAIDLTVNFAYLYSSDYASTGLYFLQSNLEGAIGGQYAGFINIVLSHLRITSGNNPYIGQGFSMISYISKNGSGQGWTYAESFESGKVELRGFFNNSLSGIASGVLDETVSPRKLSLFIEPIDLISPPAPDLKVSVISPIGVSPGQTFNYILECRNDGLVAATDAVVINYLDILAEFLSASQGSYYDPYAHQVSWGLGSLPPKTIQYLNIQVVLPWGLPEDLSLENRTFILDIVLHSEKKNLFGNGLALNPQNKAQVKIYNQFVSVIDATWQKLFINTNIITGPLEVHLAMKDIRTSRNGVGVDDTEVPGPLIYDHQIDSDKIFYSAGCAGAVNQAINGRLSGGTLYLISPQYVTQEDIRAIKPYFDEIRIYQGDDLVPDKFYNKLLFWAASGGDGKFSKNEIINWGKADDNIEDLLMKIEEAEGNKTWDYLEFFPSEPGNRIKITWTDGTATEFLTTYTLQPEDNVRVVNIPMVGFFKTKHQDLIPLFTKFMEDHGKLPDTGDTFGFLDCIRKFYQDSFCEQIIIIRIAKDPNEKLVSPEGEVAPGDRLEYTIKYENEGAGIAYGVYITDTLEEDLNDVTLHINNDGIYNPDTRTISWFIGEVGPGGQGSVSFNINVKEDIPDNSEVINFAKVYFPSVPEETRTNGTVNPIRTTPLDDVPPVTQISVSPMANENGWRNSDTIVTFSALDNEGGSGVKEIHYSLTGAVQEEKTVQSSYLQLLVTNEGITNLVYYANDNGGNTELANQVDLRLDKNPPELTMPNLDSTYIYNSKVQFDFSASDSLSGVVSSAATFNGELIASGDIVELNQLGINSFKLEATDHAGNIEFQSIVFNVEYDFSGFLPPVEADGSGVYKQGRTLPIKFRLQDVSQAYVASAVATLTLQQFSDEIPMGEPVEVESTSGADIGNMFRYDPEEEQYIFNLNTKSLSPGAWQLQVHLDDGATKTGTIKLK